MTSEREQAIRPGELDNAMLVAHVEALEVELSTLRSAIVQRQQECDVYARLKALLDAEAELSTVRAALAQCQQERDKVRQLLIKIADSPAAMGSYDIERLCAAIDILAPPVADAATEEQ